MKILENPMIRKTFESRTFGGRGGGGSKRRTNKSWQEEGVSDGSPTIIPHF